ncbi:MAG TPA: hypothetical protein VFI15_09090 [Candidatus Limnocylindrales bacterium]|nr:hypothetical protein [Candidatus Limnocylindrales bacterium]
MQQSSVQRSLGAPALVGVLLVAVGVVALIVRDSNVNLLPDLGTWGWPYFVIVPGVILLGLSLVPQRPRGTALAVAGAVVTTVGGLLLYQSQSGHWESWAYAWALLPGAAGLALLGYGAYAGVAGMRSAGTWLAAIGALLFVAGAWFFEGLFAGEPRPVDIGNWWPVGVIVVGAALALWAIVRPMLPGDGRGPGEPRGSGQPRPL